jgi:hypothetical protein
MSTDDFKACRFCKEQIRASAIKCRFCGEWLESPPPVESALKENSSTWRHKIFVIAATAFVGTVITVILLMVVPSESSKQVFLSAPESKFVTMGNEPRQIITFTARNEASEDATVDLMAIERKNGKDWVVDTTDKIHLHQPIMEQFGYVKAKQTKSVSVGISPSADTKRLYVHVFQKATKLQRAKFSLTLLYQYFFQGGTIKTLSNDDLFCPSYGLAPIEIAPILHNP